MKLIEKMKKQKSPTVKVSINNKKNAENKKNPPKQIQTNISKSRSQLIQSYHFKIILKVVQAHFLELNLQSKLINIILPYYQ